MDFMGRFNLAPQIEYRKNTGPEKESEITAQVATHPNYPGDSEICVYLQLRQVSNIQQKFRKKSSSPFHEVRNKRHQISPLINDTEEKMPHLRNVTQMIFGSVCPRNFRTPHLLHHVFQTPFSVSIFWIRRGFLCKWSCKGNGLVHKNPSAIPDRNVFRKGREVAVKDNFWKLSG